MKTTHLETEEHLPVKEEKKKKKKKKDKKDKKRKRKEKASVSKKQLRTEEDTAASDHSTGETKSPEAAKPKDIRHWDFDINNPRPMVESSALPEGAVASDERPVTLLLFYQYVEPAWSEAEYAHALKQAEQIASKHNLTGRMRVAREGFNCTLTAMDCADLYAFFQSLRDWNPVFYQTEFKLTHDLPPAQAFKDLKIIKVIELVHYGLEGRKAPPIQTYSGTHLHPSDYHKKLAEPNTVVIDVRNHYEAVIGHFQPPEKPVETGNDNNEDKKEPPKYLDPLMRKSTEFPVWLDHPDTQKQLKGKQVMMFCTGGIRCERASALLKYKMETDDQVKDLGIKGVFQLQGGVDNYFKKFPDGGYWKGKNYVFDKRFAHAPVEKEASRKNPEEAKVAPDPTMGKCQACGKQWDKYRGKRRCPTCGVPSLICRDCLDKNKKISVRCELCVEQDIRSKRDLRAKEVREIQEYEERSKARGVLLPAVDDVPKLAANPDKVTRLFLKNMCRKNMTEDILIETFPGITHIVWRTDRKSGQFFGQGWVEMESPDAAASAVARSGEVVLGRPLYIVFQKPDGKDAWPPSSSSIKKL